MEDKKTSQPTEESLDEISSMVVPEDQEELEAEPVQKTEDENYEQDSTPKTFVKRFSLFGSLNRASVSYTHLTLPTIYSV